MALPSATQLLLGDYNFLSSQLTIAAQGNTPALITDPTGIRDLRGVGNNIFNPSYGTADTLFGRFTFNSFLAGLRGNGGSVTDLLSTTVFDWGPTPTGLAYMAYSTQGVPNALGTSFNNDLNYSKHYGGFVQDLTQPSGWNYSTSVVVDYSVRGTTIIDATPRLISNLISNQSDQTLLSVQDDPYSTPGGRNNPLTGVTNPLPYSMYLASWGQYLDHGLDLVLKGVDGKVLVPILPGDDMYTGPGKFLSVSRTNTSIVSIQAGSTNTLMTAWGLLDNGVPSFNPVTSGNAIPGVGNNGTLMLNGKLITFANATSADVLDAINAQTVWTGVAASLNATGRLVLSPTKDETFNTISPHLDLSQDYGSDPSQRIYLLEYTNIAGTPTSTGNLLNQSIDGVVNQGASGFGSVPRWSDIKANAAKLGLILHDYNVSDTPQLKLNTDGTVWLDPVSQTARFLAVNNTTGALVEITDTAQNLLTTAGLTLLTVGHAFLNDRAPFSLASDGTGVPGFPYALTPAGDNPTGYDANMAIYFTTNGFGTFQPLAAHVIAGDGRTNENIGLTGIQEIWHNEHNRNVENIKQTFGLVANLTNGIFNGTYTAFAAPGAAPTFPGAPVGEQWTGEMLFQAAKIITESHYQHVNFAEFIRKISPNIDAFQGYNIALDAKISAEFASSVYRFGHSMLAETLNQKDANGVTREVSLLDSFLAPTTYNNNTAADLARGSTLQVGNEIDEWVTDTLRNNLVGQKLDLATANIARGRDSANPSLNDTRASLYQQTGLLELIPYASWDDFGSNLLHGVDTLKEFIMAYAHDDILVRFYNQIPGIAGVDKPQSNTLAAWQAFQLDPTKADIPGVVGTDGFYSGSGGIAPIPGAYSKALSAAADLAMANPIWMGNDGNQDFWNIDLWSGGLAEIKALGSMLGTTMDAVFAIQMNNLQNADRLYYITRLGAAQNILASFDEITLADLVMRNSGATHLYSDVFSVPDAVIEIKNYADGFGNPLPGTTYASVAAMKAAGAKAGWVGSLGNWTFTGNPGNYTDARGVLNPNLAGNASELIIGTNLAEKIDGLAGNETIWGDGGNDTVQGGDGNDFLHGGDGNDLIIDLAGDDYLWGDAGNDLLRAGSGLDIAIGGEGNDTIYGGQGADLSLNGGDGNDLIYGGDGASVVGVLDSSDGADVLNGGRGNDTLYGGGGNDGINGDEGDDFIYGGIDNNSLDGFDGNDQFFVDATQFGYQNAFSGGIGFDTVDYRASNGQLLLGVRTGINIDLGNVGAGIVIPAGRNVKDVFLSIEKVWGSRFNDIIITGSAIQVDDLGNPILGPNGLPLPVDSFVHGWDGNDSLTGGLGNDSLDGGLGNDSMAGLVGDDIYFVDAGGDVVTELLAEGTDSVVSSVNYTLSDNLENLTLLLPALVGIGNADANSITGNAGNNTLDGGAGADQLIGGLGDDTYIIDNLADAIFETGGQGTDTVLSSLTYTLGLNLENLTLSGADALNGTGNAANNVLNGNDANNQLSGLTGNDALIGLAGNDTLEGGAGIDSLVGGVGDDIYIVDNISDVILESAASGTDTVQSSATYTLSANVENLSLTGITTINGTGNGENNVLLGNSANNTLSGLAGNDTLDGGSGIDSLVGGVGDDIYIVDTIAEVLIEAAASGTDTVQSSVTWTLGTNFENLSLVGTAAINGTGNTGNNLITGNAANNVLNGGTGIDSLAGGLGNDTYIVDSTTDIISEAVGGGVDTVQASVTYTLGANLDNLTLTGATAINGTGNADSNLITGNGANNLLTALAGNDSLDGGVGNDSLNGGTGTDILTGGTGTDRFQFVLADSLLTTTNTTNFSGDTITDYAFGTDVVDGPTAVTAANMTTRTLAALATYTNATISAALATNLTATGANAWAASRSARVTFGAGTTGAQTFLVLGNAVAGYQAGGDAVIKFQYTGTLTNFAIV